MPQPSTRNSRRPGKAGGKRDLNRKRRLGELCDAALDLFLERGIANVSVEDIVRRAGTSKGNFYRYFDNQEALVVAIMAPVRAAFQRSFRGAGDALGRSDREAAPGDWLTLAANLSTAVFQHPRAIRLYLQESRAPAFGARAPIRDLADELLAGAIELGHVARARGIAGDEDPRVSAVAIIGAAEHMLFAYLSGTDLGNPADIPRKLIAIILDGVRPRG